MKSKVNTYISKLDIAHEHVGVNLLFLQSASNHIKIEKVKK